MRGLDRFLCDGPSGPVVVEVECRDCGRIDEDVADQDVGTVALSSETCRDCGSDDLAVRT